MPLRVIYETRNCCSDVIQEGCVPLLFFPHTKFVPPCASFLCPYAPTSIQDSSLAPTLRLAGLTLALKVTPSRKPTCSCHLAPPGLCYASSPKHPSQGLSAVFLACHPLLLLIYQAVLCTRLWVKKRAVSQESEWNMGKASHGLWTKINWNSHSATPFKVLPSTF